MALAALAVLAAIPVWAEDDLPPYATDYDWDRLQGSNVTLNVYNWGEYISVDDGEEMLLIRLPSLSS